MLVDAAGTLLHPIEPVAVTYARIARAHGVEADPVEVGRRFRAAFARPGSGPRYVGDGRPFWRAVVAHAVGSDAPALFEALYEAFAEPRAWRIAPGAEPALDRARAAGLKLAVVSDWDARLRPLLAALGLLDRFDALAVSCEIGAEKPDPALFLAACHALGVAPAEAVHVGDDPDRDAAGARAAGCTAWSIGTDVADVAEALDRAVAAHRSA